MGLVFYFIAIIVIARPAYAGLDVFVEGEIFTQYDDNITYAVNDKLKDIITSVSLGLGMERKAKTNTLTVLTKVTEKLFNKNSSFTNTAQELKVEYIRQLTKFDEVKVVDQYTHAEEPLTFEDAFGRSTGLFNYFRNDFEFAYLKELSNKFSLKTDYGNEYYQASREDINDSLEHRINLELDYAKSSATTFLLGYEFFDKKFESENDVLIHSIISGFRQFFTKQLYLETKGGVSLVDTFQGSDLTKPNILVSLVDDVSDRTKFKLNYQQDSFPSTDLEDVFESWRISANLLQQLNERLSVEASSFYGEGKFITSKTQDTLIGLYSRLAYDITKDIEAFMAYTHSQNDSTDIAREYKKNIVSAGLNFHF